MIKNSFYSNKKISNKLNIISYISFKRRNIFITVYKTTNDIFKNNIKFIKVLYSSSCGSKSFINSNKLCNDSIKLLLFKFIFFLIKNKLYNISLIIEGKNYFSKKIIEYLFKIKKIDSKFKIDYFNNYFKFSYNGCRVKKRRYL